MSERGEVEVVLPLNRWPTTRAERAEVSSLALAEARRLVAPTGGRLLAVTKRAQAVHPLTGELALKVTFAVEAPEKNFERERVFPVP